ncbi:MAG: 60Kd inner rane protein [Acidimicrobiales bacterium]|nr:60Kd inner rane protein [Acidimicrobiales bacterium]
MYDLIARPLAFFYTLWPSYGGAIVLLTLSIMLILVPLTLKGTRSMLAMQALQPEMKKLQDKYKDDRQKLNEEMLKFYKENNINPVSGCLPLLLQMPVFFFLYRTLAGLTHRAAYGQDVGAAVARTVTRANGGVWQQFGNFAPQHLDKSSKLYTNLHGQSQMKSFGINLADSASKSLSHGIGTAWPFILLVLAVAGTSYVQQKQVAGRTQGAQMNPQQAMLLKLMPAFFAFISLGLPAGIVVYFFVSNLFRIGQQAFITRTMYGDNGILHATGAEVDKTSTKAAAAPKPTGLLARLGVDKNSLPNPSRAKRETISTGGKPARGAAAKPPPKALTPPKGTATPPKSTKSTANGKGATPSRKAPPTPANRSRNKKKRK